MTVARLLGLLNAQLGASTAVLVDSNILQDPFSTMPTERDSWWEAYVSVGKSCRRPPSSGKHYCPYYDDEGSEIDTSV